MPLSNISHPGCGHKLYMDNFFSSPDLFNDLAPPPPKKIPVVGKCGYIERECPRTSNPRHWDCNVVIIE